MPTWTPSSRSYKAHRQAAGRTLHDVGVPDSYRQEQRVNIWNLACMARARESERRSSRCQMASILGRWQKTDLHRASQKHPWTEEEVRHMDKLALQDHTSYATSETKRTERNADRTAQEGKNSRHPDFELQFMKEIGIALADPSRIPRSQPQQQQPQQTWQTWWSNDKWLSWSSRSQDQWRKWHDSSSKCTL